MQGKTNPRRHGQKGEVKLTPREKTEAQSGPEVRVAEDGCAYSWQLFEEYYHDEAPTKWKEAKKRTSEKYTPVTTQIASNRQSSSSTRP